MKKFLALVCFTTVIMAGCGRTVNSSSSESSQSAASNVTASSEETVTEAETSSEAETSPDVTEAEPTEPAASSEPDGNVSAGGRMDMYPALYQAEVSRVFEEVGNDNNGNASIEYALRDLDADGLPELLFKYGTCEADYQIHIYTVDEECELKDLGIFGGGHTSFCYDENTGKFVLLWGHMGSASIMYCDWINGTLEQTDHYDFTLENDDDTYDKVLEEKGIKRMDFVGAWRFDANSEITSYVYHSDGSYEEKTGLYLDLIC